LIVAIVAGAALHRAPSTADSPRKPESPAAVVDGLPVPMAAYRRQLRLASAGYTGPRARAGTPTGRTVAQLLENQAVNAAIAEVLIDHTAAQHRLVVSDRAVADELARMAQAAGGMAALRRQARIAGISMDDVRALARHILLRDQLALLLHDPGWLNHLVAGARIKYNVGHDAARALIPSIAFDEAAPPFVAADLAGRPVSLANLAGRTVVLTFWSTTCGWCAQDLPLLLRFAGQHPAIFVVALDRGDSPATARAYIAAHHLQGLTIWLDGSGQAADAYTVSELPATFCIDRMGILRSYNFGPLVSMQSLDQQAGGAARGVDNTG
jgi:thiol-disulfide isomerase/thioredoxin